MLEGGIELALLVEDHPALGSEPPAHALGQPRLGDVEDRQRVGQLALEGDDERQRWRRCGRPGPGRRAATADSHARSRSTRAVCSSPSSRCAMPIVHMATVR